MVILGRIELAGLSDLCPDLCLQPLFDPGLRSRGDPLLPGGVVEDDGLVLGRVGCGYRVMVLPEDIEELLVRDPAGVVDDLNRLRVVAEIVIGRVLLGAACVAYQGRKDTVDLPEPGIRSPESAQAEGGCLDVRRRCRSQAFHIVLPRGHGPGFGASRTEGGEKEDC